MKQSLSEFLNLLNVRSAHWSNIALDHGDLLRFAPGDGVFAYFVVDGSVQFVLTASQEAEGAVVGPGDVILMPSGAGHEMRPAVGVSSGQVTRGVIDLAWPGGFDPMWMANVIKFRQKDNPLHMGQLGPAPDISKARPMLTRAVSFMLICAMRKHPESQRLLREANIRDPITRAVQVMETHSFRNWTVNDLAKKVGLGRSTFASRFHAEIGKPPMEVLTDIRMEFARKLVTKTELKISDVAERVGYHSSSAFIRRFIHHFNVSPGTMRTIVEGLNSKPDRRSFGQSRRHDA